MNLIDEIRMEIDNEEKYPNVFQISKHAEETIYFFANQMEEDEDKTLDILLNYLKYTDVCIKVLEDLGYQFDPKKM